MLDMSMVRLHNNVSMQNGMHQRLTDMLVCLGPRTSGTGIQDVNNYWTGEVLGDNKADGFTENAYIVLTNPHTQEIKTFDGFTSPERRGYFSIAFDLAGLEVITWETGAGDSFIHFYHNVDEAWKTLQLPFKAYSPVVALDFFGSFSERSVDVTLSYLRDGKLYCRYQRERYLNEHVVVDLELPKDARIRTAGIMSDWRFGWRFYERIVDRPLAPTDPTIVLRDVYTILLIGGEVVRDKQPAAIGRAVPYWSYIEEVPSHIFLNTPLPLWTFVEENPTHINPPTTSISWSFSV